MSRKNAGILSIEQVCAILETSSKCGHRIKELQHSSEGLRITFQDFPAAMGVVSTATELPVVTPEEQEQVRSVETLAIEDAEIDLKDDRLANMILEDPAEYERLHINGDLEK